MLPNHTLCAGWGHFPKIFTQLPQLPASIPFPPLVFGSFPHLVKLQSRQEIRAFWAQKLRRPVYLLRPKAPCSQNSNPPPLGFFLVRAESFSKARGKFLNFTAHWSTFSAPWPYQHSNNSNEGKWWRKSPNPDLVMEGQGSWWSAACTGSSFLSHPNWQPESESSFSLRSLGDSTFQVLIFTNPQEREGWNLPNDTTNINK